MPTLLASAADLPTGPASYASVLVSDAMHLRSIYSHRYTPCALKFYKIRNSHMYHRLGFTIVLLHTVLLMFESPRGQWELITPWLKFADQSTQEFWCWLLNTVFLVLYLIDLSFQLIYSQLYWRDVDWANEFVKKKGVKSRMTHMQSSMRSSTTTIHPPTPTNKFHKVVFRFLEFFKRNEINIILLLNAAIVLFMTFNSLLDLPSKGSYLRPWMFIFLNYRLQTAGSAMCRLLTYLLDIFVILAVFLISFAFVTSVCLQSFMQELPEDTKKEQTFKTFAFALINYYGTPPPPFVRTV